LESSDKNRGVFMLKVGLSETNITPATGLRMAGMLQPPLAQGVQWPLFARSIVFDDGIQRAAIISMDNLLLAPALIPELRQAITPGTSLDPGSVMLACTHTHRAPFAAALMDEEINFNYVDFLRQQLANIITQSMASRQAAKLKVGRIQAPGWTFNRRQVYRSQRYGEQVGTQGPQSVPEFIRNEGPEDNELLVLLVEAHDGRTLGGLVNFACHTTIMGGEPVYSADYAGPLTEALARKSGGVFGFLQGAAGNLWSIDTRQDSGRLTKDFVGPEHALQMGEALAHKALEALESGQELLNGRVTVTKQVLHIPQRRVTCEQVELAKWYLEEAPQDLDQGEFTQKIYGRDYTFYNNDAVVQEWFARETIGMWEWQRRVGTRELIEQVEIQVIAVGDVAFVGLPGEIFTEYGLQIKAHSPFAQTFVVELANGWHGYIPTVEAFAHGGYETRLGYTSRLVPESGDRMAETALSLLAHLKMGRI
jgi:neutral ceramidase